MSHSPLIEARDLIVLLKNPDHDVVVVDCRYALLDPEAGALAYADGHIPGAVYADLGNLLSSPGTGMNGRHPLPDPEAFAQGMAALGAGKNSHIIAYDAGDSMFAARLWWLLRWTGHKGASVLNGGLRAWVEAGGDLSTSLVEPERGDFELKERSMPTVTFSDVLSMVREGVVESGGRMLVDARSPDRYRGENETIDPAGGHIPGAVSRYFQNNLGPDGRFKSAEVLREEFQELLGDARPEQVVHQCGSGVSACHNLLAMEVAGLHGGSLYPGSWSEWCRQKDDPVAK